MSDHLDEKHEESIASPEHTKDRGDNPAQEQEPERSTTGVTEDSSPPTAAPPAAETSREVPITALLDEREKRQVAERRLAELEEEIDSAFPADDDFGFAVDPEFDHGSEDELLRQRILNHRIDISETFARQAHDDFDSAMEGWQASLEFNPTLLERAAEHAHPAEFAYQEGKRHLALLDIGDPESFRDRLRREIEAELGGGDLAAVPSVPAQSLATERDAGDSGSPAFRIRPISEILNS